MLATEYCSTENSHGNAMRIGIGAKTVLSAKNGFLCEDSIGCKIQFSLQRLLPFHKGGQM
jgi:hypothetical protein